MLLSEYAAVTFQYSGSFGNTVVGKVETQSLGCFGVPLAHVNIVGLSMYQCWQCEIANPSVKLRCVASNNEKIRRRSPYDTLHTRDTVGSYIKYNITLLHKLPETNLLGDVSSTEHNPRHVE